MAGILRRTLIVPPIFAHYAVAFGSWPEFRVQSPNEIRVSVCDHVIELSRSGRYLAKVHGNRKIWNSGFNFPIIFNGLCTCMSSWLISLILLHYCHLHLFEP